MKALLPLLLLGQIDLSEVYQEHTLIEANCQCSIPDGASPVYFWAASHKVDFRAVNDNSRLIATAPPGRHTVSVNVLFIDWENRTTSQQSYSRSFRVEGDDSDDEDDSDDDDEEDEDDSSDPPNRLVIVSETSNQTAALNGLLQRVRRQGIASIPADSTWIVDPSAAVTSDRAKVYIQAAKSLPYYYALRDGKLVSSGSLPVSYSELERELSQ